MPVTEVVPGTAEEVDRIREADRFCAFVAIRPDACPSEGGVLWGDTIAVKDNIAVCGMPFTAGHPLFADRIAKHDAEVVKRLRQAGGRIIGVTQTDAGGFGVTTPSVINPVAPALTAGGSSGGSAAAVASRLVTVGVGTDTGGSVRIPAACCGVYGFKPTWGRVPLDGVWPLVARFDHVGVIAGDLGAVVRAAAALLRCDVGALDAADDRPFVIGVDYDRVAVAVPPIRAAILHLLRVIEASRIGISSVTLPDRLEVVHAHRVLVLSEARSVYSALRAEELDLLAPIARRSLAAVDTLDANAISDAEATTAKVAAKFDDIFAEVDVVLTPTLLVEPPPRDARTTLIGGKTTAIIPALVSETCAANLVGCPAIALPYGLKNPIPVSFQLMAPRGADARLLKCAGALDRLANGDGDSRPSGYEPPARR